MDFLNRKKGVPPQPFSPFAHMLALVFEKAQKRARLSDAEMNELFGKEIFPDITSGGFMLSPAEGRVLGAAETLRSLCAPGFWKNHGKVVESYFNEMPEADFLPRMRPSGPAARHESLALWVQAV